MAAELALQEENDQRVITLLKYRLGSILTELKRKFKRFKKRATVCVVLNITLVATTYIIKSLSTARTTILYLTGVFMK